jgi:hypothetical protein
MHVCMLSRLSNEKEESYVERYAGFPASAIHSGIGSVAAGRKLAAARSAGIGSPGLVIVNEAVWIGDAAMVVENGGFG